MIKPGRGLWLLVLGLTACGGHRPSCPAPEKYNARSFPDYQGRAGLGVKTVERAPKSCPGPGHPVLEASMAEADAWIHVVTASVPDPKTGATPWVFIDAAEADRRSGLPFYTRGPVFWDNPGWGRPAGLLLWEGEIFPVKVEGKRLTPLAGLAWGFRWEPGQPGPEPLPMRELGRDQWGRRAGLLADQFPGWEFVR